MATAKKAKDEVEQVKVPVNELAHVDESIRLAEDGEKPDPSSVCNVQAV